MDGVSVTFVGQFNTKKHYSGRRISEYIRQFFCRRRKTEKLAAENAAEFVKFSRPPQKFRLAGCDCYCY